MSSLLPAAAMSEARKRTDERGLFASLSRQVMSFVRAAAAAQGFESGPHMAYGTAGFRAK